MIYTSQTGTDIDTVLVAAGLPYRRYQEYLSLLKKTGIRVVSKIDRGQIEFQVWRQQSGSGDSHTINYVFSPDRSSPQGAGGREKTITTELAPNWFLQHKIVEVLPPFIK